MLATGFFNTSGRITVPWQALALTRSVLIFDEIVLYRGSHFTFKITGFNICTSLGGENISARLRRDTAGADQSANTQKVSVPPKSFF